MREQRHPDDTLRWVRRGSALAALLIGWTFILVMNHFHITPPVVFVCLGYFAAIAAIYTLYRTGATAVSANDEIDDPGSWGRPIGELSELEREKRTLLKAIKEAEFDHQMGKLSKADADGMIAIYRARAIEVIKEIDVLNSTSGKTGTVRDKILREARARIEVEDKSTGAATKPGKKKGSEKQKARADKLADAVGAARSSNADDSKADDSDSKTDAANESKADSKADAGVESKVDSKADAAKVESQADGSSGDAADKAAAKGDDAAKVESQADGSSGDAADEAAAKGDETDAKSDTKADAVSDKTADKTDADKTDAKPDTDKADAKADAAAQKAKPEASDNPAASVDSDATDKAESKEAAR